MATIRLAGITVHPIKSCGGVALQEVRVMRRGPYLDREWMLVDERTGKFISQRTHPKLALVTVRLKHGTLTLDAPTMPSSLYLHTSWSGPDGSMDVHVWDDTLHVGCVSSRKGRAQNWFQTFLADEHVLLVRMDPGTVRPSRGNIPFAEVAFADGFPFLGISRESLVQLNEWLPEGEGTLPMNRFRPNLEFEGGDPFAEDTFGRFRIGDVEFQTATRCARCSITTVDQQTGVMHHKEPLRTLSQHRMLENDKGKRQPMFGVNIDHFNEGTIRVGDEVVLLR